LVAPTQHALDMLHHAWLAEPALDFVRLA